MSVSGDLDQLILLISLFRMIPQIELRPDLATLVVIGQWSDCGRHQRGRQFSESSIAVVVTAIFRETLVILAFVLQQTYMTPVSNCALVVCLTSNFFVEINSFDIWPLKPMDIVI
jgi:hypothetical protein